MTAQLTIAPIPFHWSPDKKRDFYYRIADEAPVETVYLGEVICSKRAPFFDSQYADVADRLQRAGKTVVFSSLAEIMLKRERKATEELCSHDPIDVEINNAAGLFHISGKPHRVGPFLNVYNEETLSYLASNGATHVCLPVELPGQSTKVMASKATELGVGIEVQVFGRASLAMSARCYHARAHGRTKDNCQFVCEENPDGMPLKTLDDKPFLFINGIQTMSNAYVNLCAEVPTLVGMGVTHLRLVPQDVDMIAVAQIFSDVLQDRIDVGSAEERLINLGLDAPFSNGFWHGKAGYKQIDAARAPARS